MRLIDADALFREIKNSDWLPHERINAMKMVREQPTIAAVPVVYGQWVINKEFSDYEFSACGQGDVIAPYFDFERLKMNYCHNLGDRMDGEEK